MLRSCALFLSILAAPATAQQPATEASVRVNPTAARSLLERDWVLMNWALKFYDRDHDILLEPSEAAEAAAEFRKLADKDGDGRVTPLEYRAAREVILAAG